LAQGGFVVAAATACLLVGGVVPIFRHAVFFSPAQSGGQSA